MAKNRETVFVFHDHGKLTTLLLYIYIYLSNTLAKHAICIFTVQSFHFTRVDHPATC